MSAILQVSPEQWDREYQEGAWERLKGYVAHYAVVGALVRKHGAESVLDVGCGEGRLLDFLHDSPRYLGMDVSAEAICRKLDARFFIDDATKSAPFCVDCVVFCESLYYMENPLELVARYLGFAKFAVISIMISDKTNELVDGLREKFKVQDEVEIRQGAGGWRLMVLQ